MSDKISTKITCLLPIPHNLQHKCCEKYNSKEYKHVLTETNLNLKEHTKELKRTKLE